MSDISTRLHKTVGDAPPLRLHDLAELVRDFVDILLPGSETWPSAGVLGVQAVLVMRLADLQWEDAPVRLGTSLPSAGAPFYERADRIVGVSGLAGGPAMPPCDECPTGPLPFTKAAGVLGTAFDKLGWHWWPAEAGVSSETTGGVGNPTSTISALALRTADDIRDNFRDLSSSNRAAAA